MPWKEDKLCQGKRKVKKRDYPCRVEGKDDLPLIWWDMKLQLGVGKIFDFLTPSKL